MEYFAYDANKTNSAMYPKKILLSVFIFALVVLAGKVLVHTI